MDKDLAKESPMVADILIRVRGLVKRLLERQATPADVSFVLAYVATELGLVISEDPVRVFPVLLNGLSRAATDFAEAHQAEAGGQETLEKAPPGVAIH